jgi:tetratricopeptide (TPR) repeat protein
LELYKRWPEIQNESIHMPKFKKNNLAITVRKVRALGVIGKDRESLQLIDDALQLPSDREKAVQLILSKFNESLLTSDGTVSKDCSMMVVIKELLIERSKAYVRLLKEKGAEDIIKDALDNLELITQIFPEDIDIMCLAAQPYIATNQFDNAYHYLKRALELNPSDKWVIINIGRFWNLKGTFLVKNDKLEEALTCYQRASQYGEPSAAEKVEQVKKAMENEATADQISKSQAAFEAFDRANSIDEMRTIVDKYKFITKKDSLIKIEEIIHTEDRFPVPTRLRLQERFGWLQQIVAEKKNASDEEQAEPMPRGTSEEFLNVKSIDEMRQLVSRVPFLINPQTITMLTPPFVTLSPDQQSYIEQRIAWLRQIADEQEHEVGAQ